MTDEREDDAMLVHGKVLCIVMMGNDVWKHQRDYEGLVKLVDRWNSSLKDNKLDKEYKKELERFLLVTWEGYEDDWIKMNDLRILSHRYMNEFGDYPSDEYEMPDMPIIQKIRELTDS